MASKTCNLNMYKKLISLCTVTIQTVFFTFSWQTHIATVTNEYEQYEKIISHHSKSEFDFGSFKAINNLNEKKILQRNNYKVDLRIYLEAHVSFVFICVEVNKHQIMKKILLPQNQQVRTSKNKRIIKRKENNKKAPKQQKEIHIPVGKRDF